MDTALVPLSMSSVVDLPERCRSCVSWEMPASAAIELDVGQASFEKEVWFSGVMLTWGSAGQILLVDGRPAGFALYAPPTAVPGALAFPSGPVSPDAVLLTTARILPEYQGRGLARYLMNGVVAALTGRGVRAIELFGVEANGTGAERFGGNAPADGHPAAAAGSFGMAKGRARVSAAEQVPKCLLPAAFARAVGFTDVAPHHRYPRLRFELESGIGWKEQVESALEKLFSPLPVRVSKVAEPALV